MLDQLWRPTISLQNLLLRSQVLWNLREFFHKLDFAEVQTPILSRDTVIDRHIDPVRLPGTQLDIHDCSEAVFYLQTSPEFGMKRLLAAGAKSIYQIAPVFRAGERGQFHNPEFTMVEWYRVGDDLIAATNLLASLLEAMMPGTRTETLTYQSVFHQYCSVCPLSSSAEELALVAIQHDLGVDTNWSGDRDDWLNLLFSEVVQPKLGADSPTIVTHYPASQSALARVCDEDSRVAERFELFIRGVELANGYHELLDAAELKRRNDEVGRQRLSDGKSALPIESRLIAAMEHGLPSCSGCALGLDRLLMIMANAEAIDQVISFPIERA